MGGVASTIYRQGSSTISKWFVPFGGGQQYPFTLPICRVVLRVNFNFRSASPEGVVLSRIGKVCWTSIGYNLIVRVVGVFTVVF